jgi:hypothetical protein
VHVETAPGVIVVVAAWMLDPVACVGMELGYPRVSISALIDLHDLLIRRGLRRSSAGDAAVAEEEQHDRSEDADGDRAATPTNHSVRLNEAAARHGDCFAVGAPDWKVWVAETPFQTGAFRWPRPALFVAA